jgi:hypothetical protein
VPTRIQVGLHDVANEIAARLALGVFLVCAHVILPAADATDAKCRPSAVDHILS